MGRRPRVEAAGAIHHVTTRGNGGQRIVTDDRDRVRFMDHLAHCVRLHRWECWAYCLMDNHFHLVVETPEPNLGIGMKWLKVAHTKDFNFRHKFEGHLFGGRFYSRVIETDAHLLEACIYVLLNPVRGGLVRRPSEWPWSSYRCTAGLPGPAHSPGSTRLLQLFDAEIGLARQRFVSAVALTARRDPGQHAVASARSA